MPKDPRLRAIYLLIVAVGVFILPGWRSVAAVALAQIVLWLCLGLGITALALRLRKLTLFCAVILIAYSLVSTHPDLDDWYSLPVLFGYQLQINLHGAVIGITMVLRIFTVVIASNIARAGNPKALAAGLRGIGMPSMASLSLDATLSLLGGGGGNGGGGGGGGRGGKRGQNKSAKGFITGVKRFAKGDVNVLAEGILSHVAGVERHVAASHDTSQSANVRDVAVISGLALTMLGIKALKLLPGMPFAPGHKGVVLVPLYIVAGFMTKSKSGSTVTGLTMGTAAFLLGDGRWGVFEIIKHVAPGVLVDVLMPALRLCRRTNSRLLWAFFGMVIAIGRFATITVIALALEAPSLVYAILLPSLLIHAGFGVLSGLVTAPLLRNLDTLGENPSTIEDNDRCDSEPDEGKHKRINRTNEEQTDNEQQISDR